MPGRFKYVFKAWSVIHQGRRKGAQYLRYYYKRDMPTLVRGFQKTAGPTTRRTMAIGRRR
jgi:hypothetical protein